MKTAFEKFPWSQKLSDWGVEPALQQAFAVSFVGHILCAVILLLAPYLQSNSLVVPKGIEVGIASLPGARGAAGASTPTKEAKAKGPSKASKGVQKKVQKKEAPPVAQEPPKATPPPKEKKLEVKKAKQSREDLTGKKDTISLQKSQKPKSTKTEKQDTQKRDAAKNASEPKVEQKESKTLDDLLSGQQSAISKANTGNSEALGGLDQLLAKSKAKNGTGAGGGSQGTGFGGVAGNLYHASLQRRIKAFWHVPAGIDTQNLASKFELQIARDGQLISAKLVQSSGSELFDASASAALRAASPFDPVPQSIQAPYRIAITLIPDQG